MCAMIGERVNLGPAFGRKSGVLSDGVWVVTINPKHRMVHAIADAVCSHTLGHLPNSAQAKRF
jgi:hypothetical protein